ncbi:MAG: YqaA family protein [Castellaniella sp.]|uniref:YqaA family protein n=1 Tax=Castellaniella sp. TaxID=1955812 RepID=UPI002A365D23|nr:YqaA family protein [Castellaniella sp.]MDY0308643.1 YqaA family protein [Castellaniella sp.]
MEAWLQSSIHTLLTLFALPKVGLPAIFLVSLVSATLLPMGSEPAVFAYVQLTPSMFWPAVLVATVGNTLGGSISYAMGAGAEAVWLRWRARRPEPEHESTLAGGRWHALTSHWFQRFGPPALLLSWLPGIGDPLCAVAGWLRLPFWPCVVYMAIGKFLRYVIMTAALLHAWPWVSRLL